MNDLEFVTFSFKILLWETAVCISLAIFLFSCTNEMDFTRKQNLPVLWWECHSKDEAWMVLIMPKRNFKLPGWIVFGSGFTYVTGGLWFFIQNIELKRHSKQSFNRKRHGHKRSHEDYRWKYLHISNVRRWPRWKRNKIYGRNILNEKNRS